MPVSIYQYSMHPERGASGRREKLGSDTAFKNSMPSLMFVLEGNLSDYHLIHWQKDDKSESGAPQPSSSLLVHNIQ